MSDQDTNRAPDGSVADKGSSATVSLPPFVQSQLGKERSESLVKEIEHDPDLLKDIQKFKGMPEFFDDWRTRRDSLKGTLRIPKDGASKEEWDRYFKATGRPDNPQDYALDKSKLPEGMVYDKPFADAFQAKAHKLGLPVKAVQELYDWYSGFALERSKAIGEQQKKQEAERDATRARDLDQMKTALRIQWGDRYDSRMPRNVAALQNPTLIPTELSQRLDKAGFLRDPVFHLWWDRYVSMTTSDRKLGLPREEGDGTEEEANAAEATVVDKDGNRHLKPGFFASTAKRHPARKKAS